MDASLLDDPIGSALWTKHASFAVVDGGAARYPADVAPFASVGAEPTASGWAGLSRIAPDGGVALFVDAAVRPGDGWRFARRFVLTQMVDEHVEDAAFAEAVSLGEGDVPAMVDLARRTEPGPFERRTVEFGGYRGVRSADGALLAMAGRRLAMPGWVEVSAVCTDAAARGNGYAGKLVRDVVAGIRAEGDRAFLHVAEGNPAQAIYERLGFTARRDLTVAIAVRA